MDFVSGHHGAIPGSAMKSPGQFEHPLVTRAKCEISAAALANGVIPSHNVTTELNDLETIRNDASRPARIRLPAHVEHPSQPDRPDRRSHAPGLLGGSGRHRDSGRRPSPRTGADPARWKASRPRFLPLLLGTAAARRPPAAHCRTRPTRSSHEALGTRSGADYAVQISTTTQRNGDRHARPSSPPPCCSPQALPMQRMPPPVNPGCGK